MLNWLRRALKRWLTDEATPSYLEIFYGGRVVPFVPSEIRGVMLLGALKLPDGDDLRLVYEGEAVDRDRYWRVWKKLAGNVEIKWEDGEDFRPPVD